MSLRTMFGKVALLAALGMATAGWSEAPRASFDNDTDVVELDANTGPLATHLMSLERHVKWAAVSKAWAAKRDAWQSALRKAKTPAEVAAKLGELETAMGWDAVQDTWKRRREGWVREVAAAKTDGDVARLLLELESSTKWSAVEDSWKGVRDGWVAGLKRIERS